MITKYDKPNLREIKATMKVALEAITAKYGIHVGIGGASYTDHEVTFKVKLSILDESGDSKEAKSDWKVYAPLRGLSVDDFGKEITHEGHKFKITGWNQRRRKYPVEITETATGRIAHAPVNTILWALGKNVSNLLF